MHKFSFYPRMALGNLWRNKSTYLPYLLACVVSIASVYILLAINFNGALDSKASGSLLRLFAEINREGQTILMVTHSPRASITPHRASSSQTAMRMTTPAIRQTPMSRSRLRHASSHCRRSSEHISFISITEI